jgi:hypothetical protein
MISSGGSKSPPFRHIGRCHRIPVDVDARSIGNVGAGHMLDQADAILGHDHGVVTRFKNRRAAAGTGLQVLPHHRHRREYCRYSCNEEDSHLSGSVI